MGTCLAKVVMSKEELESTTVELEDSNVVSSEFAVSEVVELIDDKERCISSQKSTQFRILQMLGTGICCQVFKILELCSGKAYAMKAIPYKSEENEQIKRRMLQLYKNECDFLKYLKDVPGIVRLAGAYIDDEVACIVTELGKEDLFNWGLRSHKNREIRVKYKIKQILETVSKMHSRNVVHRDIKPENIILARNKNKDCSDIRLIDFGEATIAHDDVTFDTVVGTLSYLSPERFYHHKGWELKASDIWAIGVVTFELLTRKKCFVGGNNEEITKKLIIRNEWQFPSEIDYTKKSMAEECQLSSLAKHFIRSLLTKDPRYRPSAKMALTHPWFLYSTHNHNGQTVDKMLMEWNTTLLNTPNFAVYESVSSNVQVNIW